MSRLLSALALVLVASATLSHAQDAAASASNTTANGSNSSARVGWVSPGSRRSTWDILWTCFSVFLICSWKCTHLNIPSAEESEAGWHKWHGIPYWPERLLRRKWRRKAWWMVVIALAPEVGVAAAVEQYINAREDRRTAEERAALRGGGGPFSMAHAFYANMGGFALAVPAKKSTVIKTGYGGVVKDGGENGKPTAKGDGVKPGQSQALEYRFLNLNSFGMSSRWPFGSYTWDLEHRLWHTIVVSSRSAPLRPWSSLLGHRTGTTDTCRSNTSIQRLLPHHHEGRYRGPKQSRSLHQGPGCFPVQRLGYPVRRESGERPLHNRT